MFIVDQPGPDYTLRWPWELFAQEGRALASSRPVLVTTPWSERVELLLEEAFATLVPRTDFLESGTRRTWTASRSDGLLVKSSSTLRDPNMFLWALINAAERLPQPVVARPYYAARLPTAGTEVGPVSSPGLVPAQRDWLMAVKALQRRGYLAEVAPPLCENTYQDATDPDRILDELVAERLGVEHLWWQAKPTWDELTFFSLVEIFHDLVTRPRSREMDSYNNCGWHYHDFAGYPAQVLYRWTINRILSRHGLDLALAKSGADIGRLVRQPSDGRELLIEAATSSSKPTVRSRVDHAIGLFRNRNGTVEDKRSACIALVGVLEERRALIKAELLSRDEGDLFEIANKFGVRHRDNRQRSDYDPAFLDWVFWWYLSTIELTNKLLARQSGTP
jgi:hypothetical protein